MAERTRPSARAQSIVRRNVSSIGVYSRPELARGTRAVVAVPVQQRADHLAAQRRLLAADAVRQLHQAPGGARDRRREDPRLALDAPEGGHDLERLARRDRRAVDHVPLAVAAALGSQHVRLDAVRDVDDADVRVDERRQLAVQVGDQDPRGAAGPARALHRGGVDRDELDAGAASRGERGQLALVLRPLVDGQERPTMRRVLVADRAPRLSQRGGGGGEHDARHAGAGGGAYRQLRSAHVDVEQRGGVVRAHRVDARDVVEQRAVFHARGERVLVEHVAADHPRTAGGDRALGRVRARQRDDLVAALGQPTRERPADQAAPPGEEDARHAGRSPRVSAGHARAR